MTTIEREDIIDESSENFEDPDTEPDKDETLSELWEEKASKKPVHQRMAMSDKKMSVHVETARERYEAAIFKYDTLRRKFDIRRSKYWKENK